MTSPRPAKKISRLMSRGFITLVSVLILGAIAFTVSTAMVLIGIGTQRSAFLAEQAAQGKALANACAEEALQQMRDSSEFVGSSEVTLGKGVCSYTVTDDGGENRTVTATGTVGTVIRKVKVILDQVTPPLHVVSWQEVADF